MALRYDLCGYAVSWQQIVLIVAVLGFCTMEWCGFCEVAISACGSYGKTKPKGGVKVYKGISIHERHRLG